MTSSRTGTAKWLRIRAYVIKHAKADGQTNCPICTVTLDYDRPQTPRSAEVDHIVPHSKGGTDDIDNLQVLCRRCNASKGNRGAPKHATVLAAKPLKTSRRW